MRKNIHQFCQYRGSLIAVVLLSFIAGCGSEQGGTSSSVETIDTDVFGVRRFYADATPAAFWDSKHWQSGGARALALSVGGRDSTDPTGWSQMRGSGDPQLYITDVGTLDMSGGQPRLYINPFLAGDSDPQNAEYFFENVEFTGYFRRLSETGAAYGGFTVGVRSGPLGHGSADGDDCDATTYYSRLRNDGQWQFQKELKHPDSAVVASKTVFSNEPLPLNQWIGMKFVVYTLADGAVRLQAWIDFSEAEAGGDWQLLGEYLDDGQWLVDADYGSLSAEGCQYGENKIISPGGGTVFVRNTDGHGEYKWLSVREINPN